MISRRTDGKVETTCQSIYRRTINGTYPIPHSSRGRSPPQVQLTGSGAPFALVNKGVSEDGRNAHFRSCQKDGSAQKLLMLGHSSTLGRGVRGMANRDIRTTFEG